MTKGKIIALGCFAWICGVIILVEAWLPDTYPLPQWARALVLSVFPAFLVGVVGLMRVIEP